MLLPFFYFLTLLGAKHRPSCTARSNSPERLKALKKQLAATRAELKDAEAGMSIRAPTKMACEGEREGVKDSPILNLTPSPHAAARPRSLQPRAPVENDHASARVASAPEWMLLKEDWEKIEKVCRSCTHATHAHECKHAIMCMRRCCLHA